jgi:hypothetical protein
MILMEKKDYSRALMIATVKGLILGFLVGLAWGFCAGILFQIYRSPKPPAPIVMKGVNY